MADKDIGIISTNQPDTRLALGADGGGERLIVKTRDTAVTTAFVTNRMAEAITEAVTASDFKQSSATTATYDMEHMIPEGAVVLGVRVTVETGFLEDTTATLKIGSRRSPIKYHTTAINVFAQDLDGAAVDAPSGSQVQITGGFPTTLTLTSSSNIAAVVGGSGAATITIYFSNTQKFWCLQDAGSYLNHILYVPQKPGTCTAGSLLVKMTNSDAEQIAVWEDYYFEVQYWLHTLVAVGALTPESKYIFNTVPFNYAPYTFTTLITAVDGYAGGYSLAIPHYVISDADFAWYAGGLDAMDLAQTLIRKYIPV